MSQKNLVVFFFIFIIYDITILTDKVTFRACPFVQTVTANQYKYTMTFHFWPEQIYPKMKHLER